uniref:SCP domain-containing protein n=1 Tax=Caenorhabditis japonica TaxID=281687 RepID=A0A8R1HSG8_CAEJA
MKTIVASLLLCFGSLAFLLPKDDENLVQDKGFYDEKIVVKRINDERLEFAKKFNVTQMFELIWSPELAEKAALLAKSCNIPETPLIEAHHATFYKSPLVPLKLFKPGEVMAKEYLRLTEDEVKNEYYKFIPYFWNHTFIGCALMKEECHEQLLICNVEKSEFELGKAFEEGNQCSKCGRVKCDQGLCDGVPPGKGLMKKSTLMPYYSFIIFIVFLIIFQ